MTSLTKRMHEYRTIRNFLSQSSGAVKQFTKVAHMLIEKKISIQSTDSLFTLLTL